MNKQLINIIGWFGVAMILVAYIGVTMQFFDSTTILYLSLNLVGSIFILLEAWYKKDYQPVFLNFIWAVVAIISIFRM